MRHPTRFSQEKAAEGPQGYCFIIGLFPPVTSDRSRLREGKAGGENTSDSQKVDIYVDVR